MKDFAYTIYASVCILGSALGIGVILGAVSCWIKTGERPRFPSATASMRNPQPPLMPPPPPPPPPPEL